MKTTYNLRIERRGSVVSGVLFENCLESGRNTKTTVLAYVVIVRYLGNHNCFSLYDEVWHTTAIWNQRCGSVDCKGASGVESQSSGLGEENLQLRGKETQGDDLGESAEFWLNAVNHLFNLMRLRKMQRRWFK